MHEHTFQEQKLRHDHSGGELSHGYYEHPEDGYVAGRLAARRQVRAHLSEHMTGLGELRGVTAPAAVVLRKDGSADVYGPVTVVDQRPAEDSEAPLYAFSRADFSAMAGREVTDEEIPLIVTAIGHSTAGEVVHDAVFAVCGSEPDDEV
jgi:hypothetical protein